MDDMIPENNNNTDRIEALKQRLIATKDIDKIRPEKVHELSRNLVDVPREWSKKGSESVTKKLKHPTFFKKFFFFSLFVFIASIVFAYVYLSGGNNLITNRKVDLEIMGNSFVSGGEKANFDVIIVNRNAVDLELARLLIKYDKGVGTKIPASESIQIGKILSGETKRIPYTLPVIGQEGDIKDITFDLEYRIPGSNALFVKTSVTQITLRSSVLGLGIDAPTISTPNQNYSMTISLSPSGSEALKNIALKIEYPPGFNFSSSAPQTFSGKNIWYLGDISASSPQVITVNGTLSGLSDEERVFRFYAGEFDKTNNDISPVYISKIHSVVLNQPFLVARIDEESKVVPLKVDEIKPVNIIWQNNTTQSVRDIEITATISGSAYDSSKVEVRDDGEFDVERGVIVWDSLNNPDLSLANSGESGSVGFTFSPKLPILINSPNKEVFVTISIKGTPIDSVSEIQEVSSVDSRVYKMGTNIVFDQNVLYQGGPIKNTGPVQPTIGQTTTYTVVWVLSNSDSLVSNSEVRATLNRNFEWNNVVSSSGERVTYNPVSREIIWNVGDLNKNTSANTRRQVSFQVKIDPRQSNLGEIPTVLDRSIFTGLDTINNSPINQTKPALRLQNVEGSEIRIIR